MHHPAPSSSELSCLPAMYSFSGPTSLPDFDLGPSSMIEDVQTATVSNSNWETRCLRKHRRRADDEGCSAKKRRLMFEAEVAPSNLSTSTECDWSGANSCSPPSAQQACPAAPQSCTTSKNTTLPQTSSSLFRLETESSCMEIEAAQRKLQEIEDRITLEDDEDEDLDVEPAPRRPVLVMSDSLKKGLQQGISDILPHTVAQSVSRSCMELVLWRPPEDPFSQRLKDSLQKQRKQQTACRQTPTQCPSPSPSPSPHSPLNPSSPPADTHSSLYSFSVAHNSGEEEMEM